MKKSRNHNEFQPTDAQTQEVKVLYQKLGDNWYAFSEVNGDLYYSKVKKAGNGIEANEIQESIKEFILPDSDSKFNKEAC